MQCCGWHRHLSATATDGSTLMFCACVIEYGRVEVCVPKVEHKLGCHVGVVLWDSTRAIAVTLYMVVWEVVSIAGCCRPGLG